MCEQSSETLIYFKKVTIILLLVSLKLNVLL